MSENGEQQLEATRAYAHQWARERMPVIERGLTAIRDGLRERVSKEPALLSFLPSASSDVFSLPFSIGVSVRFPESLLGDARVVQGNTAKITGGVSVEGYDHRTFVVGDVVIDPTFGQFGDLDIKMKTRPDLFEGRVFVGTAADAEALGVRYNFPPQQPQG